MKQKTRASLLNRSVSICLASGFVEPSNLRCKHLIIKFIATKIVATDAVNDQNERENVVTSYTNSRVYLRMTREHPERASFE